MAELPDERPPADASRRQSRGFATRSRVLAAADELFVAHGYEGASMAQIAERAGVGVGTLYHHFPDKRALLLERVEEWAERSVAERRQSPLRTQEAVERLGARSVLESWVRSTFERLRKDPSLWIVVIHQAPRDPEVQRQLRRVQQAGADWLRTLLEGLQRRGAIRRDTDVAAAAWLVRDAIDRVARQHLADGVADPSADRMIRELVEMICRYLLVSEAT